MTGYSAAGYSAECPVCAGLICRQRVRQNYIRVNLAGWLAMERWSPYAVGAGKGVLSWLTFLILFDTWHFRAFAGQGYDRTIFAGNK
jgi:hypothetical protein